MGDPIDDLGLQVNPLKEGSIALVNIEAQLNVILHKMAELIAEKEGRDVSVVWDELDELRNNYGQRIIDRQTKEVKSR